jgi:3alpha(or 20beta)-hydroxysteroid dehydrogenase
LIDTPMMSEAFASLDSDSIRKALEATIPNGRFASAEDVARMVLYLASDDSTYSTGSEFVVDGGMTARL